jgi:hypothetical protein
MLERCSFDDSQSLAGTPEGNGGSDEDNNALDCLLNVGADATENHGVGYGNDDDDADHGVSDASLATGKEGSADDDSSDGCEEEAAADADVTNSCPGRGHHSGKTGGCTCDHEGQRPVLFDRDSGKQGGFLTGPDDVGITPESGPGLDEPSNGYDQQGQPDDAGNTCNGTVGKLAHPVIKNARRLSAEEEQADPEPLSARCLS